MITYIIAALQRTLGKPNITSIKSTDSDGEPENLLTVFPAEG